ncbi:VOC family protein [Caulobacter mirabilis]|uniref:Glyoxalase n=1 Tax=Caulobacter mirabilis TaxID=69666 RepID=A0A2D2AUF7_9CAUL|nr:VOC family protein [Caulobacter mirabilis]ATQ41640.1 glyoxalase [Caulobacter mirabilis]
MTVQARDLCPLLQVFDMPASLAFYCDALGFTSVEGTPDWRLLRLGDAWLMLNTAYEAHERPPQPDPARVLGHRDVCSYISVDGGLDALYAELVAKGLSPSQPQTQAYGMRQMYLADPDAYGVCFQHAAGDDA